MYQVVCALMRTLYLSWNINTPKQNKSLILSHFSCKFKVLVQSSKLWPHSQEYTGDLGGTNSWDYMVTCKQSQHVSIHRIEHFQLLTSLQHFHFLFDSLRKTPNHKLYNTVAKILSLWKSSTSLQNVLRMNKNTWVYDSVVNSFAIPAILPHGRMNASIPAVVSLKKGNVLLFRTAHGTMFLQSLIFSY